MIGIVRRSARTIGRRRRRAWDIIRFAGIGRIVDGRYRKAGKGLLSDTRKNRANRLTIPALDRENRRDRLFRPQCPCRVRDAGPARRYAHGDSRDEQDHDHRRHIQPGIGAAHLVEHALQEPRAGKCQRDAQKYPASRHDGAVAQYERMTEVGVAPSARRTANSRVRAATA